MTKLKLIKKLTSDWFDSHKFVNQVYWGDFIRWYADKQIQHSSVVITPIRVTEVTRSKRAIQLQITYADRVYSDFRNLDEVHSDADRTLADFILSASNDKELRKFLTGLTSGNIEYFTNRTGDLIAGATMSVSLNVFSDANSCEIPVDFAPQPTPFECLDANYIVEYEDGTLIEQGTIPSGGSKTIEVPNVITCLDANYTLTDSLGNVLDSGTIASGGSATITAPDATVNINKSDSTLIQAVTVASGGVEPYNVADSVITVNSATFASVKATDSLDVPVVDSNGDAVATTVVGGEVQVDDLPCASGVTRSTATLLKTGKTVSYRTGDDGDLQAGRDVDFFTLDSAPIHNDGSATINTTTNRFTDTLGGQTYANNIVLDWSTWNGTNLLGWARDSFINDLVTWNDAIDNAISYTNGDFVTGFRLPNDMELMSISYKGTEGTNPQVLQYPPPYRSAFDITSNVFWSGTVVGNSGNAYVLNTSNGTITSFARTNTRRAIYARTFNLSTTNILS